MSHNYESTPEGKDPYMWEVAKRRASFRYHIITYFVVIGSMWVFWALIGNQYSEYPWPVWPTLGWGIGLVFHYLGAFVFPRQNSVDREYEKLMRDKK